jgi:hypothetical protein
VKIGWLFRVVAERRHPPPFQGATSIVLSRVSLSPTSSRRMLFRFLFGLTVLQAFCFHSVLAEKPM